MERKMIMTKRKFVKQFRSIGVSESTIRNYTNMVAKLGGKMSYQDIFDKLMGYLIQRCLYEDGFNNVYQKMDFIKPYVTPEFNFDNNYFIHHYCDSVVLNPSVIRIMR